MTVHPLAGAPAANQFGEFAVAYATPAQVKYIKGLLASRDTSEGDFDDVRLAVAAGRINKKHASAAITLLLSLPKAPVSDVAPAGASPKQAALIERLVTERVGWTEEQWEHALATKGAASAFITFLLAAPRAPKEAHAGEAITAGMYYGPKGQLYRAYLGQQSGQILCKEVVGDAETGYTLEYRGLATRFITAGSRRMTLDEAKSWGKATGHCCKCGARLDVPESVDAGIGPWCAGKEW